MTQTASTELGEHMNRYPASTYMSIALTCIAQSAMLPTLHAAVDYIYVDGFEPPVDCSAALVCPIPQGGKACISGQLTDAETSAQLRALFYADKACDNGAAGGPCDLALSVHDMVAFISNPSTSTPLPSETLVDGCGRFRFSNFTPPPGGFIAILADDAAGQADLLVATATPHAIGANQRVDGVNVLSARRDTVNTWTQSAGSPFGASSFADVGAILFSFRAGGIPQSGVSVTRTGNTSPADDYYFSDTVPTQRLQIDNERTNTGINGAALFVGSNSAAPYSGVGGEPAGCVWPTRLAASIPSVVLFIEIDC